MKIYRVLPLIVLPTLIAIAGSSTLNKASAQSSQQPSQALPQCNQQQQGGNQQMIGRPQDGKQQKGGKPTKVKQQTNWGSSQGRQQQGGQQQPPQGSNRPAPDFATAAQKLGVSEADLKAALGVPATP